jgi:hypothetical protein
MKPRPERVRRRAGAVPISPSEGTAVTYSRTIRCGLALGLSCLAMLVILAPAGEGARGQGQRGSSEDGPAAKEKAERKKGGGGADLLAQFVPRKVLPPVMIEWGDKDKAVSREEFVALADDWFGKLDAEKAGKLSPDLFASRFGSLLPSSEQGFAPAPFLAPVLFSAADLDKDGSLTEDKSKETFENTRRLTAALIAATMLTMPVRADAGSADALVDGFQDPPSSARPRVWWHWMNGNVTKDGIAKDLEWMKRVGIGGLQNFDANLLTPQIVPNRLVYMTPEWKEAFHFAASKADELGLELSIAASPGWSETGGPWVKPEDGLKKLVWSETEVTGSERFSGKLAPPPSVTGPFQALPRNDPLAAPGSKDKAPPTYFGDIAVLAYPVDGDSLPAARVLAGGRAIDGSALTDASLESAVEVAPGSADNPATVTLAYDAPRTVRSATLFIPGAKSMFSGAAVNPHLEASDDGTNWRKVADIAVHEVPATISFAPATSRQFRIVLAPGNSTGSNLGEPMPGVAPPAFLTATMGGGPKSIRIADLRLSSEPKIDQFETKAGFSIARDYYALSAGVPELTGVPPSEVIDLTGWMEPDGTLDWTPPPGKWRIVRLGYSLLGTTNHPAPPEATGLEVDNFDGPAVRNYLETYLGMYRDAAGPDLIGRRGVRALLTDSIEVGAANWTPKMIGQFKRLRGYDPTPWLPALTGAVIGSRAQSDKFLYDYRRTLADLMASEHYGTVAQVAHEHGLKVYGEALEDNRPSLGDDMAMRSYADVPMSAMWTFSRERGPNPSYLADIKGAASVAHIYGQNLVAAESLTSALAPWAYAPADLKRIIDLEFVTGVNRPVIHTSVHQPVDDKIPGLSLFIFGQYFNRHESWAEMAKPWVDYLARNGFMLQQGRNFADVAYFYGEEAPLTGLYGQRKVDDAPTRYAHDFANSDVLLNQLSVDNGDLVARSGARYRVLYLGGSSERLTLQVLRRLAELAEAGATIVGTAPTDSPSLNNDGAEYRALIGKLWSGQPVTTVGKGRVIAGNDVEAALASIGVTPDFTYSSPQRDSEILFLHRRLEDGDIYFVNNRKNRPEQVEARFRVIGKAPEIWRADAGTSEPVSYRVEGEQTAVPLDLAAEDSFFVVFRKPAAVQAATVAKPAYTSVAALPGPWDVLFQEGRGAPAAIKLASLGSLSEQADPGVKYFSGISTYTMNFTLPEGVKPGAPLLLDLGQVGDLAEVRVNGRSVGTVWHAPYRIDIGQAVERGNNTLEVKVANLWVNRLIGDAQPGAKRVTFTTIPTYQADAPLRPSGLIGPVRLLAADGASGPERP